MTDDSDLQWSRGWGRGLLCGEDSSTESGEEESAAAAAATSV